MKNNSETVKPGTGRFLMFKVDAERRPFISISGCLTSHKPRDWSIFGIDACEEEMERRQAIDKLMTADEQDFFDKYCRLRDE